VDKSLNTYEPNPIPNNSIPIWDLVKQDINERNEEGISGISKENSEIILDFQKFLSNKHSMSLKEVDGYIQTSISSKISEFDSILDLASRASEVTYDFAVSEGYNRATELKMAIVELSESLKSIY